MKARPRSVENKVAEYLSAKFTHMGLPTVERIPVLGRTGPDITIGPIGLVIDVKSRLSVPETIFFPLLIPFTFDDMTAVRLRDIEVLWEAGSCPTCGLPGEAPLDFASTILRRWLTHMDAWRASACPDGISAIVCHRPKLPIGEAVLIIQSTDRKRLYDRYTNIHRNIPAQ